jgi:uncharacterized protein YigE (DUF2233 family)
MGSVPLGPREKSELELHWSHQKDHVYADIRNLTRRMQNQAEREAFKVVAARYQEDGTLLDLRTQAGALESIVRDALPEGS